MKRELLPSYDLSHHTRTLLPQAPTSTIVVFQVSKGTLCFEKACDNRVGFRVSFVDYPVSVLYHTLTTGKDCVTTE